MTNLLIQVFIKGYEDINNFKVRQRYGKFAGIVGIISNFILFVFKMIFGMIAGSISIIADAVNSFSDSISSIITLFGFKISGKPADAKHPYGHARMEYISGLIISLIIFFLGIQLIRSSIDRIISRETVLFDFTIFIVLIISIFIKLWQSLFYRKISRLINSAPLKANSVDSRNDIFATLAVLISAVLHKYFDIHLDGYAGLTISVLIIISGLKMLNETISPLLGLAPSDKLVNEINKKIMSYDKIIGIHDLRVHSYGGSKQYASVHCEVPADFDIMESHDIIDNIEKDFEKDMNIQLVIHLDPVITDDPELDNLKLKIENIIAKISPDIEMHDFRVSKSLTHTNLIFDISITYDLILNEDELIASIKESISTYDPKLRAKITVDYKA